MINKSELIEMVSIETGEPPDTVERIVKSVGRASLTAFAECEMIPHHRRVEALRAADEFSAAFPASPYSPSTKGFPERLLSQLDRNHPRNPDIARSAGGRIAEENILHDLAQIGSAPDPWNAFLLWLDECRALNRDAGGDEFYLIATMLMWNAKITLPVNGGQK